MVLGVAVVLLIGLAPLTWAATTFEGTVVSADAAAGKLVVSNKQSGARFTFIVTKNTAFEGEKLKSLADLTKGQTVQVDYETKGTQYMASKVASLPQ
jgi:hypothetical protein